MMGQRLSMKKVTAFFILLMVGMTAMTGCGSTATEESKIVQVQSINGNEITAVVGELLQETGEPPERPVGNDGQTPPERPAGDDGQTPPERSAGDDGQQSSAPSSAERKPGGDSAKAGRTAFTAGEKTLTFTVAEDTAITLEFVQGSQEGTLENIAVGSVLEVTVSSKNVATAVMVKNLLAGHSGFGGSDEVTNGTAVETLTETADISGEIYTSSGDDENALRVDGAAVSLTDITVEKNAGASSNTENGDFYGQNAALLAINGATVNIEGATIHTSAVNGNGVFSYGSGTTVNISDAVIRTTERNSGGIQTTGGGTTNATKLDIETQGTSAAAIRSDRGGGTVNVDQGEYSTFGTGSPAVYCTADITVSEATLTANASEAVVVEGQNNVSLYNCQVSGNMQGTYADGSENIQAVMIYQSMSGDAEVGHATFTMDGGSLTALNGDLFYVTNTSCDITLSGVALNLSNDVLLKAAGNDSSRGWGTAGANGGKVTLLADGQQLVGNIFVDDISTLDMTMRGASSFTGAINSDGTDGTIAVTLAEGSVWTLTGDSYLTSFNGDIAAVVSNGYQLYVNGEAIV